MNSRHFAALFAASATVLTIACTGGTSSTQPFTDPEGTDPTTSSSGGSSGKTSSSSSGGKTSSSGGSSSGGSSSGGSSSGGSSSGGSSSGKTSSSGGSSGFTSSSGASSGGSTSSSGGTGDCPQDVPLTVADLDTEIGWKSAVKQPGSCSAADLTQLQNNFSSSTIATYLDLGTGLSASCKACAISYDTDANWGPIVATFSNGGDTGFINFGACFGAVEGAACGKALQYEQFCYNIACNECTTTSTERQKCVETAGSTGMCSSFGNTTASSCPNIATTATSCNSILDSVKYLCQ